MMLTVTGLTRANQTSYGQGLLDDTMAGKSNCFAELEVFHIRVPSIKPQSQVHSVHTPYTSYEDTQVARIH
jgi:hypothetical protein